MTLERIEVELAAQDAELERLMAAFEEVASTNALFEVPSSFFEELAELCKPRALVAARPVFGLRA